MKELMRQNSRDVNCDNAIPKTYGWFRRLTILPRRKKNFATFPLEMNSFGDDLANAQGLFTIA